MAPCMQASVGPVSYQETGESLVPIPPPPPLPRHPPPPAPPPPSSAPPPPVNTQLPVLLRCSFLLHLCHVQAHCCSGLNI